MKNETSVSSEKKQSSINFLGNERKRKNYYERFLELMARKTDSEKRIQVFGTDPFK